MSDFVAVRSAIDLLHTPSRVPYVRTKRLPGGIGDLLRIAAGDESVEIAASEALKRPRELIRSATIFFMEQILLSPEADSYRILGLDSSASATELRANMALMLRWLHPDLNQDHSIFARRVTAAWENLKTAERRASYDQERARRRNRLPQSAKAHRALRGPGTVRPRPRNLLLRAMSLLFRGGRL